ncbi:MAG: transglycosylase SLT domain-containing protein [Nitrospiraceae bacterium]
MSASTPQPSMSSKCGRARAAWPALLIPLVCSSSFAVTAPPDFSCVAAEDCFYAARAAQAQPAPPGVGPSPDDRLRAVEIRLRLLIERQPGTLWAKRGGLLLGVRLATRDPAEAARFLRAAQRDFPLLDDYIRFWLGESLLRTGDAWQAGVLFESVAERVPDTLLINRAAFRGGEAWFRAGDCGRASGLFSEALSRAPQDPSAPAALLMLADCHARESRADLARAALTQLWVQYPQSPEAREAQARLAGGPEGEAWRPTPEDLYARGLAYFFLSLNEEAVDEFQKFLSAAPAHSLRHQTRLRLGTALVRVKRYEQARDVFRALAAERTPEGGEAAVWLARIYVRQGDGEGLRSLQQSLPDLTLSAEQQQAIKMYVGTWLEDQGLEDEALKLYRQVGQASEQTGQRVEALWRTGWIHYRTGQFPEAASTFREVLNGKEDGPMRPQAQYWLGRALERHKDPQAEEVFVQVCRRYPLTYYCQWVRSHPELPSLIPASAKPLVQSAVGEPAERRTDLGRDVHYRKALELKLLGLNEDAARELAALTERVVRDRAALLQLAALLSEAGDYYQALRVARLHFLDGIEQGGDPLPSALWTAAYPTGYLPTIQGYAGQGLDPYLVAAIIREESLYDPRAVSRTGAVGLMQVMPVTAQAVSRRLGLPEVGREELFNQDTNIRLGVGYLEQLLRQFSGNVLHAVAAYNAGPTAVSSWMAKYGGRDPDEFVEFIPYQETRQYVKRVLRSYREYHRLGGGACGSRSLDKVC